jgi:hypothetical protein
MLWRDGSALPVFAGLLNPLVSFDALAARLEDGLQPPIHHPQAGVIQQTPAPPGSRSTTILPTLGISKAGFMIRAPALTALATLASTSSTAM